MSLEALKLKPAETGSYQFVQKVEHISSIFPGKQMDHCYFLDTQAKRYILIIESGIITHC